MGPGFGAWRRRALLALGGAAFGVLGSAVNHGFGPLSQYTSKLLGNDWAWLTACLLVALSGTSWSKATKRSLIFVWCAVVGYYVTDSLAGTYDTAGGGGTTYAAAGAGTDLVAYLIIGAIVSAGMGLLVILIRRSGLVGLLASLVVPGYIAHRAFETHRQMLQPGMPQDQAMVLVSQWVGRVAVGLVVLLTSICFARLVAKTARSRYQPKIASHDTAAIADEAGRDTDRIRRPTAGRS